MPTSTPAPTSGEVYGSAISADSLANTQVGGTNGGGVNTRVSYRFRAGQSAALSSVRIYLVDGSGYSGGNGGTLELSVQTDANGLPSGTVLATKSVQPGNPISIGYLPLITFPSPPTLVSGRLYHLVFRNTDPSPTTNFVSVNALYTWDSTSPRQPRYPDSDWALLINQGGWAERARFSPILDLGYGNGAHEGVGYMEIWVAKQPAIGGNNQVRECFTPTGGRTVSSVSLRLKRDSATTGTSPLEVMLLSETTTLGRAAIPATAFPLGTQSDNSGNRNAWATATFASSISLEAGRQYCLVLSAPADTLFRAEPIRKGQSYRFSPVTYFADGYGQKNTGSGWVGFDQPGGSTNNTDADVQFYFR